MTKQLKVPNDIHEDLFNMKRNGESFGDVLRRLIRIYNFFSGIIKNIKGGL